MSANIPDIPDNDPKTEKKMIQRGETPQASTDLWSLYLEEANKRAKGKADLWNGSLSAFLLFAGLFAGVVSSFVIDSRAGLQPNASANLPSKSIKVPVSTVAINFLWFTSLTFTLISALAAVLAQTWVVEFSLVPPNDFKGAMERWIHDDKAEHWQLNTAIAWITVLIQLALFLFLAGFAVQAVVDHRSLGWTILSFVGATLVLYIGITVLPLFYPATPFRTPFSQLVTDNEISHLSNPNAVKNRRRGIWEFIISTWKKLFKAPTENEVRLGICWAILQHSSNTATIHAAVLELTAKRITPDQSEQLVEFGLPHELSNRLAYLPPLTEAQTDTVERLQNYLHVIMWMVDGCGPDVAEGFSILLRQGGLLLKLNALPPSCRGVAFAIRVHLLVNIDTEEEIDGTDWTTLIDCLDQSFALDVFRAAILGLEYLTIFDDVPEKKRKMAHLRQDCARMLAAYAGSTRFSNAHLVASRMTGDPLRITRPEQETVEQIHVFFSQLEEAWKRSMCTRAIRSMEDVRIDRRIMGFSVLSSVAKDENFRDAISDVLPELGSSLNKVDWETSVECLGRLSEIYKQGSPGGTFRKAIRGIFPRTIRLLVDSKEEVRAAVHKLIDQMKTEEWVVIEIDRIAQESVKDLRNADWDIRIAGLESLTQLVKTGKISNNKIIGEGQNIMACTTFFDEDVRLSAIRTLQELAKHERFHRIIDDNMDDILGLVSDDDSSVRAAAVDFVYELAGQVAFQRAINRNLPAFITENYGWQPGFARCGRLQALGKIIESGRSYDNGIQRAFGDLLTWLSDGQDVCQTALQIISLAAEHRVFWAKIEEAIPEIAKLFETEGNNEDVRVAALRTCAGVARVAEASFLQKLSAVIPIITKLFKSKDKGVRLAAFETCAEIAKTQPAALQNTINNIMTEILRALNSTHGGHTQIAALHTLSTFAELDDLRDNLDDNVISKIISGLLDDDDDVQTQTLDTLAVLASKEQFHNNVKGATQNILPLLEDRRWWIRQKALDTFAVFALNGILDSDDEITTRIISMLSEGDTDASASVLNILYIAAKQDVTPVMHPEILVATTLLSHPNSRVRVAALEVLQSLADDPAYEKINFPALTTIMNCISNETEGVQVAGLRTMFKFIDVEIFRDRGTVPETVLKVISSLLQSSSEDTRISVIGIISSYSTKAEFFSTIQSVIPTITKLLKDPDGSSDTRVIIIRTLCDMAKTDNLWTGSDVFVESVGDTLRSLLSDNQDAAVRIAALQIVPVITQHNAFREIVDDSLQVLLLAAHREDAGGTAEDIFRIKVLSTLSDLAKHDSLRKKIDAAFPWTKSYTQGTQDRSWPTHVALLKLMSVLGTTPRESLKTAVVQILPEINDTLHDSEDSELRMAGVQLLSIPAVKEIPSSEFNSLVATLVTLLSDPEEKVQITALHTLSELAKQEVFRDAINRKLPALLESLEQEEWKIRVAALKTCAALAGDVTFCEIVKQAAPQIMACIKDPDYNVQLQALNTLSQLSREEAFWLTVSDAAPHIMSQFESPSWSIRVQVLRTLSVFIENDAFGDIINSVLPRILESLSDRDDDVRVAAAEILVTLIQHSIYQAPMRRAFQDSGLDYALSTLSDLTSDPFRSVRMAVLPLIPKVAELDVLRSTEVSTIMLSIVDLLSEDKEEDMWIAALDTISALVKQDVSYAEEIPPKPPKLTKQSVGAVVNVIPTIFSLFERTKEQRFWDAAAEVLLSLASIEGRDKEVHDTVVSCVISALDHSNPGAHILGLNVLAGMIGRDTFELQIDDHKPSVLKLLDLGDLDVRLSALRVAVVFNDLPEVKKTVQAAIETVWREMSTQLRSVNPSAVALEKLVKLSAYGLFAYGLSAYVDVSLDERVINIVPPFVAALKDQPPATVTSCLHALSKLAAELLPKLAAETRFYDALSGVVPKITALWSNKRSDTQLRLEILQNLFIFAEHPTLHAKIREQVPVIISALKDGDAKIRAAALKVLLKLVEGVSPDKFSERIKSAMPVVLTLIHNATTLEDSIGLIACLAGDKTLRIDVLAKVRPSILGSSRSPTAWGHLRLMARLFEEERLDHEETDLQFFLCLVTSKRAEVQDFVLKFMTTTLQQYLVNWTEAEKFPASFLSAFSSLTMLKN